MSAKTLVAVEEEEEEIFLCKPIFVFDYMLTVHTATQLLPRGGKKAKIKKSKKKGKRKKRKNNHKPSNSQVVQANLTLII